jgi:membrane protein insertase Oxa1/YidC/SpoIIIJ
MENNLKDEAKNILHRITSPWFFTFIPWWVVFNYDFLLRVFGKFDTVDKINEHYCGAENFKYSIFGCVKLNQEGWLKLWYSPLEWTMNNLPIFPKFIIPFGLTVISLKFVSKLIIKQENNYYANTSISLPLLVNKYKTLEETSKNYKDEYKKIQQDMIDKEMEKLYYKHNLEMEYIKKQIEDLKK